MMEKGSVHGDKLKKYLTSGVYATYYIMFRSGENEKSEFVTANPDLNLAIELWNIIENDYV